MVMDVRRWLASGDAQRWREKAGLTRGMLAREIGVDTSAVFRWENGERKPRGVNNIRRYHRLLCQLRDRSG